MLLTLHYAVNENIYKLHFNFLKVNERYPSSEGSILHKKKILNNYKHSIRTLKTSKVLSFQKIVGYYATVIFHYIITLVTQNTIVPLGIFLRASFY